MRRGGSRWRAWCRAALLALVVAACCLAAAPIASATCSRTFILDGRRGPVISGSRTVALAGAVTGIAEGAEGGLRNPAALANRPMQQGGWVSADVLLSGVFSPFRDMDFDGDGVPAGENTSMYAANAGLVFQFGGFGIGTLLDATFYNVRFDQSGQGDGAGQGGSDGCAWRIDGRAEFHQWEWQLLAVSYAYAEGEVLVGGSLDGSFLTIDSYPGANKGNTTLGGAEVDDFEVDYWGLGARVGVLWRPPELPFRLGGMFRLIPLSDPLGRPDVNMPQLPLPSGIELPWELALGASFFIGPSSHLYNQPISTLTFDRRALASEKAEKALGAAERAGVIAHRARRAAERALAKAEAAAPRQAEAAEPGQAEGAEPVAVPVETPEAKAAREAAKVAEEKDRLLAEANAAVEEALADPLLAAENLEDRRYILLSVDTVFFGGLRSHKVESYTLEGYVTSRPQPLFREPRMSLHLGAESEVWHDRLKLRLGIYSEADRLRDRTFGRMHLTGGVEVGFEPLFLGWRPKIVAMFDVSRGYQNFGLGIGTWH